MFKDDYNPQDDVVLQTNLRAAYISATIMTFLISLNFFCALTPYNLELIAILFTTVYMFVYVKFIVVCGALKDIGYKRLWLKLYRVLGLVLYLVSALLCMLGIG